MAPGGSSRHDLGVAETAATFKGFTLNDFQRRAAGALAEGRSVLLSAPTGAGKTLVAEIAIERSLGRGKRAIYTAPIKALSNQKYRDFRDDPDVDVGLMTGDVTIRPEARLVIMTTEILRNTLLEDAGALHDVEYVIFDEVHYLDDLERGTVWEESLILAPEQVRFVCLSATVPNLREFGDWIEELRGEPMEVIEHLERPVELLHRMYHPAGGTFALKRLPKVRQKAKEKGKRQDSGRGGSRRGGRGGQRGGRKPRRGGFGRETNRLLDHLAAEDLLPALVFCFSRRECEIKASRNLRRRLLSKKDEQRVSDLLKEICALFEIDPHDEEIEYLRTLALRGLGYHHAGMMPIHKELTERLFTSGLIKMLFTTETFALGINMPARTVVFDSLRKFDGISFDYLRTRDYLQMAGRAGRQGIDDEGLVVSVMDGADLAEAPMERIIRGNSEPVKSRFSLNYSTLLHLYEDLGEGIYDSWERSFNAFQHRKAGKKRAQTNARRQRKAIRSRINFLQEGGFLKGQRVTDRGQMARNVFICEIQITELVFRGLLDHLDPPSLAALTTSMVFQARRKDEFDRRATSGIEDIEREVKGVVMELVHMEEKAGIPAAATLQRPDFRIAPAAYAWAMGAEFADLEHFAHITPGDLCRSLRQGVQVLRHLGKALGPDAHLTDNVAHALICIDRDVVDARRQLQLG